MTHSDNCLERAKMHDRLAVTTNDTAARQMHQAMAAEFRRRAGQQNAQHMPLPSNAGPVLEIHAAL